MLLGFEGGNFDLTKAFAISLRWRVVSLLYAIAETLHVGKTFVKENTRDVADPPRRKSKERQIITGN